MHQNPLNLIRLLDPNTDSYTIHARLDEDSLLGVAADGEGVEEHFRARGGFDFGDVVAFRGLGGEVGEGEGGGEGGADGGEVGAEGLGHFFVVVVGLEACRLGGWFSLHW